MIHFELTQDEAESNDLPMYCIKCGDPATVRKEIRYWKQLAVNQILYAIAGTDLWALLLLPIILFFIFLDWLIRPLFRSMHNATNRPKGFLVRAPWCSKHEPRKQDQYAVEIRGQSIVLDVSYRFSDELKKRRSRTASDAKVGCPDHPTQT